MLRYRHARSTGAYVLEAARLTALASAKRAAGGAIMWSPRSVLAHLVKRRVQLLPVPGDTISIEALRE
jgi:hypothetical protein